MMYIHFGGYGDTYAHLKKCVCVYALESDVCMYVFIYEKVDRSIHGT